MHQTQKTSGMSAKLIFPLMQKDQLGQRRGRKLQGHQGIHRAQLRREVTGTFLIGPGFKAQHSFFAD